MDFAELVAELKKNPELRSLFGNMMDSEDKTSAAALAGRADLDKMKSSPRLTPDQETALINKGKSEYANRMAQRATHVEPRMTPEIMKQFRQQQQASKVIDASERFKKLKLPGYKVPGVGGLSKVAGGLALVGALSQPDIAHAAADAFIPGGLPDVATDDQERLDLKNQMMEEAETPEMKAFKQLMQKQAYQTAPGDTITQTPEQAEKNKRFGSLSKLIAR